MTPDPAGAAPFHWTAEHEEFRGVVRKLTENRVPLACAPAPGSADPAERELWRTWTTELGLPGLVIPEEHGGATAEAVVAGRRGVAVMGTFGNGSADFMGFHGRSCREPGIAGEDGGFA